MCNNENKHSGGVSCSAFSAFISLCMLLLSCVNIYAGITYGIDDKSSNSVFEDAFWSTVLRWRKARIVLARAAEKYSAKPLQPGRWQSNHSLYKYFSPLNIFASMSLAQFQPVRKRYVASGEANRFTDWAIRAPGMGFNSDAVLKYRWWLITDLRQKLMLTYSLKKQIYSKTVHFI